MMAVATAQSLSIDQTAWKLVTCDSEQPGSEAVKAFDGVTSTYWHSKHGDANRLPMSIVIDLSQEREINGFSYHPRPDGGNGTVREFSFYGSRDGKTWGKPLAEGAFTQKNDWNEIRFAAVKNIRYVKLVARSSMNGSDHWMSVAELLVMEKSTARPIVDFSVPVTKGMVGRPIRITDRTIISPESWEWQMLGAEVEQSNEQHPTIVYQRPGRYSITLTAKNANGASTLTKTDWIEIDDRFRNQAVYLDGRDHNIRIGMGIIAPPWTVEAWIKGDDLAWKKREVIIGAGEYADLPMVDALPLCIDQGRLSSAGAKIVSTNPLDDQWHHVAISCDGKRSTLYLDGNVVGESPTANSIIPGALGNNGSPLDAFAGLIDEVRIWKTAVPAERLGAWRNQPLSAAHENMLDLVAYYPFEDFDHEISVNWAGKSPLPYHLRNGRFDYKGSRPLAYTVVNDRLPASAEPQRLFNATVIHSEWDADIAAKDDPVLKLRIAMQGSVQAQTLSEMKIDLSDCTDLTDVEKVHVYATGSKARSTQRIELTKTNGLTPEKILHVKSMNHQLLDGINYVLVTFDISKKAKAGNRLGANILSFMLNNSEIKPVNAPTDLSKQIVPSHQVDSRYLRVLQWNIWHGGRHLGEQGPQRVTELIKATGADVITMQEAYGAQTSIAEALQYELLTPSADANLALYSRFPLKPLPTKHGSFQSILAELALPNDQKIHVGSWWLRYAYRPEYTGGGYYTQGQDPQVWVDEDQSLSTADATSIFEKDIAPNQKPETPQIIGGDFNSGSHLDWTKRAAAFHAGYGPVAFPTSQLMREKNYTDSFRAIHSDEVLRPDGTFAVIYGHLQHGRIDYIYHKGPNLRPIASKIIRTPAEIDFVWPSDHAAVLTTYEIR